MAKLDLALVVRTVDQATRPLRNIQRAVRQVGRQTGLDQVGRNARLVGRRLKGVGSEAFALSRRLGLIALAGGAIAAAFGQKYANAADKIAKTSARIGVSAEELQRLRHAFEIGGVSVDQTDKALLYFTRSIGDAADGTGESVKIFEAMGISLRDGEGRLKSMRALLDEVSVAFQNQESVEKKGIAAQYLFGRAGQLMLNTLSEGPGVIRELGDDAERYGLISQQAAEDAEEYIDRQAELKRALGGIGTVIGEQLIPQLTPLVEKMREWGVQARPGIGAAFKTMLQDLGDVVKWLAEVWGTMRDVFERAVAWLRETFPWFDDLMERVKSTAGEVSPLTWIVGGLALVLSTKLIKAIAGTFWPLVQFGASCMRAATKVLIFAVVAGFTFVKAAGRFARNAIPVMIAGMRQLTQVMKKNPILAVVALLAGLAWLIIDNWNNIPPFFVRLWGRITRVFDVEAWVDTLAGWGGKVAATMLNWFFGVGAWFEDIWGQLTALVDVGAWVASLRAWGVSVRMTVEGWWAGLAGWFSTKWAELVAFVDVGAWVASLRAWGVSVGLTIQDWWSGLAGWFSQRWAEVTGLVDVSAWLSELGAFSLWDTMTQWWAGLGEVWQLIWRRLTGFVDVAGWIAELESFDLFSVGKSWIEGLWAGVKQAWAGFIAWMDSKWADVLSGVNTVIEGLNYIPGVDIAPIAIPGQTVAAPTLQSDALGAGFFGARAGSIFNAPSAAPANEDTRPTGGRFGNRGAANTTRTEVVVDFRNMPRGARHRVRADREADVEVTAGYALQGAN